MQPLTPTFRAILVGLLGVIARIAAKDRARVPFLILVANHVNRTIQRFELLLARWRAGALPRQRPGAPRPARPATAPRLPRGHAWIVRALDHADARGFASQLEHLLAGAEAAAFLAAVPRAGRILRPLARSLGIRLPGDPPPPLPRPARNPPPARKRSRWAVALPAAPRPAPEPYPAVFSKAR